MVEEDGIGSGNGENDVQTTQPNFSGVGGLSNLGSQDVASDRLSNMRNLNHLISDMSKYTILIITSLISTFVFLAISVCIYFTEYNKDENSSVTIMIISFDGLINCICLLFQFDFSKKYYKKICSKCHLICENRYTKETNKRVAKKGSKKRIERLTSGQIGLRMDGNDDHDIETDVTTGNNGNDETQVAPIAMVVQTSVETLGA